MYVVEQSVFTCSTSASEHTFMEETIPKILWSVPSLVMLCKSLVYATAEQFKWQIHSWTSIKCKNFVLVEEELDTIGTQMTVSPMRRLSCLAA